MNYKLELYKEITVLQRVCDHYIDDVENRYNFENRKPEKWLNIIIESLNKITMISNEMKQEKKED